MQLMLVATIISIYLCAYSIFNIAIVQSPVLITILLLITNAKEDGVSKSKRKRIKFVLR